MLNKYEKYESHMKDRPHLVILGAGASVAAIPNGDANGKKTSVMAGFIDRLGMRNLLQSVNLKTQSDNLEDIYSELHRRDDCKEVLEELENRIYEYFSNFEIPKQPTVYDFLIISLREKDVIATFNWDPLLIQAYQRVSRITNKLPKLLFLHGNVNVGLCHKDKRGGSIGNLCPMCGEPLERIKLLYPVENKDYENDPFIKDNWNAMRHYMNSAFLLTIFGYSAPKTDKAAIDLLKGAWGTPEERNFEEIEIIDIRSEEELVGTWDEFIHTHHRKVLNSFFNSNIARFPRRSCEAEFDRLLNVRWLHGDRGVKENMNSEDIEEYFRDILNNERYGKDILTNFAL